MISGDQGEQSWQDLPYRACVGAMVINTEGLIFTGRRLDTSVEAWQMPQGGIDPGETEEDALMRELREEIGTDRVNILAKTADWLCYDLPPALLGRVWGGQYRGQKQRWFALRFTGRDEDINIATAEPEFAAWRWVRPDRLAADIVPFKRPVYERVLAQLGCHAVPWEQ